MVSRYIILIMLLLGITAFPVKANNIDSRIEGVTQFLIDRANENYFYVFENSIGQSKAFQCHFPKSYNQAQIGNLKILLRSNELWKDTIKSDLDALAASASAKAIESLVRKTIIFRAEYSVLMQSLKYELNGKKIPLNIIPLDPNDPVTKIVNQFYKPYLDAKDDLNRLSSELKPYLNRCQTDQQSLAALVKILKKYQSKFSILRTNFDVFENNKDKLSFDFNEFKLACKNSGALLCKVEELLAEDKGVSALRPVQILFQRTTQLIILYEEIAKFKDRFDKQKTNTGRVVLALEILKKTPISDENYQQVSRYSMFFAQISDSTDPQAINEILKAFTLPAVSFFEKRKSGNHFMITSYVGLAYARTDSDGTTTSNFSNIYAPIGVEYSRGVNWLNGNIASFSIMLSPFDFGYPISLKLEGQGDSLDYDQIAAPSISFALGQKDLPLTYGLAYQTGKKIEGTTETEKRILVFVAFDMPLFNLH